MADDVCGTCASLQEQIADLSARLALMSGLVRSTIAFVEAELEEPTMPARPPRKGPRRGPDVMTSVAARLQTALDVR